MKNKYCLKFETTYNSSEYLGIYLGLSWKMGSNELDFYDSCISPGKSGSYFILRGHGSHISVMYRSKVFTNRNTVDERNPANQLIGSLSHYLQGFIHPMVVVWDF